MILSLHDPLITGSLGFVTGLTLLFLSLKAFTEKKFYPDSKKNAVCLGAATFAGLFTAISGGYMMAEDLFAQATHATPQTWMVMIVAMVAVMIVSGLGFIVTWGNFVLQMVAMVMFSVSSTLMASAMSYHGIPTAVWADRTLASWYLTGFSLILAAFVWTRAYRRRQAELASAKPSHVDSSAAIH